ncbi:hypothetical protein AVEN_23676-1 [Araneus ventricosus]|uniref:Uncharacterized protein n=1 Tax=Araneus ventricosus TaxID=182803 RepID=A0A4Y2BHB0_ARAVE|nr:hypothetical protein AVEN_23676-1 [Araneus ventricosus]
MKYIPLCQGRGKVFALWVEGFQVRNPIPLKIRRALGLLNAKSYIGSKRPPAGVVRKFGERGVSSCVVLVVCPWFKIARFVPRIASKRHLNITKLKYPSVTLDLSLTENGGNNKKIHIFLWSEDLLSPELSKFYYTFFQPGIEIVMQVFLNT